MMIAGVPKHNRNFHNLSTKKEINEKEQIFIIEKYSKPLQQNFDANKSKNIGVEDPVSLDFLDMNH